MKMRTFNCVILIKQQKNYNIIVVNILKVTNFYLKVFPSCDSCECQNYYHCDIIVVITIIMIMIINDDNLIIVISLL